MEHQGRQMTKTKAPKARRGRKSRTSDVVGVTLNRLRKVTGEIYMIWIAEWIPYPGGPSKKRKFSVARYGHDEAKRLEVEARAEGMRLRLEADRNTPARPVIVEVHLDRPLQTSWLKFRWNATCLEVRSLPAV